MNRVEDLHKILQELRQTSSDIEACTLFSEDGLPIASLPSDVIAISEDYIAALSSALLSMAARASEDFQRGGLEQLFVKGDNGYTLIMTAGSASALVVVIGREANIDMIFSEMNRAVERLSDILAS